MTVADRIRMRREELSLSQEEVAHRLHLKGRSSVSKAEKAGDTLTLKTVSMYAQALNCSPSYLMGWEEPAEFTEDNAVLLASLMNDSALIECVKKIKNLSMETRKPCINT